MQKITKHVDSIVLLDFCYPIMHVLTQSLLIWKHSDMSPKSVLWSLAVIHNVRNQVCSQRWLKKNRGAWKREHDGTTHATYCSFFVYLKATCNYKEVTTGFKWNIDGRNFWGWDFHAIGGTPGIFPKWCWNRQLNPLANNDTVKQKEKLITDWFILISMYIGTMTLVHFIISCLSGFRK